MNCIHTGTHCRHAFLCAMNADHARAEACKNFSTNAQLNSIGTCGGCRHNGTEDCAFACFRVFHAAVLHSGYSAMKESGELEAFRNRHKNTAYYKMRESGELAAWQARQAARDTKLRARLGLEAAADSNADKAAPIGVDSAT